MAFQSNLLLISFLFIKRKQLLSMTESLALFEILQDSVIEFKDLEDNKDPKVGDYTIKDTYSDNN